MDQKSGNTLRTFQQWMQQQLLDPSGTSSSETSNSNLTSIEDMVCDSKRLSAKEHLAIYQRSYIARLRDCMSKVFSALEYALGEELFEAFADTYLELYPSTNYNLSDLGAKFGDYLEATRPDAHEAVKEDWPDFMIELARFEFAVNRLFDQEDTAVCQLATKDIKEENVCLAPVLQLFQFRFPIRPFYSAFVNKESPEIPSLQESYCVIIRQPHNYRIALYDLQKAQYELLKHIQSGHSVQEAFNYITTTLGITNTQLQSVWPAWKETWIASGFFLDRSLIKT